MNTSPTQTFERYVIDFAQLSEAEADEWPDLLEHVRIEVKPYRESVSRESWQKRWWLFAEVYPAMRRAIAPLDRCLVTARTSKHTAFSFQPTDRIFSENLVVFACSGFTTWASLQARTHETWVGLTSSTLESRQGYRPSDCFETFPFPQPDPRAVIPGLEDIGARLYDARTAYMVETQQGLTQTYNRLKDPDCDDAPVLELRRLHEEMDRAVLDAYGWTDLEVPPFCPTTPAENQALERFKDEVIDRLFVLNAERAAEEAAAATREVRKAKGAGRSRSKTRDGTQVSLPIGTEGQDDRK